MRVGTELMSEGMYEALESLVGLIVTRRYDELATASRSCLAPDDLRRRIEEDYPSQLVIPPREHYTVEAIMPSPRRRDDVYFLDRWDEESEAT